MEDWELRDSGHTETLATAVSTPHALVCTEGHTCGREASAEEGEKRKDRELEEEQEGLEHSLEGWTLGVSGDLPENEV